MKNLYNYSICIVFCWVTFSACSTTKRLQPNQKLLCKVTINGINNNSLKENALSYVQQDPNTKFFLFFRFNLYVNQRLSNVKSDSFWGKIKNNIGEEAVLYDSIQSISSSNQIRQYLFSKGFFENDIEPSSKAYKRNTKKVEAIYNCFLGKPTLIDTLKFIFKDPELQKIYLQNQAMVELKRGSQYDEEAISKQIEAFYNLFKNNGYYDFVRQYITIEADTLNKDHSISLTFNFQNPENGFHQQYTIKNTIVRIDASSNDTASKVDETLTYTYVDPNKKFNPKTFEKLNFIKPKDIYNLENVNLSFNRMGDLGVFKFVNIDFSKADSNQLACVINLNSRKKFSVKPEAEGTFNNGYLGANTSLNFTNRNIFKSAERFELGVKGGLESQKSIFQQEITNNYTRRNLTINSNLYIPKLLLPIFKPNYKIANPQTFFALSFAYDKRDNLYFRRTITNSFGYDWKDTRTKSHYLKLIDVTLVNSSISNTLESALLNQQNFYILRSFIPYFSLGTQYKYTDNRIPDLRFKNRTFYIKFTLDAVGNSLNALKNVFNYKLDSTGTPTILGSVLYQYTRPEIDLRYYIKLNENQQLVYRLNSGVGLGYGSSRVLPFDKQFYVGGSNSLRGWQARRLGPGSYSTLSDSTFNRLFFDQTGDFKLEANAEYRFNILKEFLGCKLNGAFFGDAGNVWFTKTNTGLDGGTFYVNNLLRDIALNTGFGLRFDYSFFVFRLDMGLKVKDPSIRGINNDKGWVISYIADKDFKTANNNYRFSNFIIGIGYPF